MAKSYPNEEKDAWDVKMLLEVGGRVLDMLLAPFVVSSTWGMSASQLRGMMTKVIENQEQPTPANPAMTLPL